MKKPDQQDREDQAVDVLIAAALRQAEFNEPTDEEIQKFLTNVTPLSQKGKDALDALGPEALKRVGQTKRASTARVAQTTEEFSPLYMAMNRKNASDEMDASTKEELEKRRREALERLKKRKNRGK